MPLLNDQPLFLGEIYLPSYSKIKWQNFDFAVSESSIASEVVIRVPNNCAVVVNGNNPYLYSDAGISKDKEHMERFYKQFYGENAVRALEYPNNSVQDFENAIYALVKGGARNITIYISSHGRGHQVVMGDDIMTADDLRRIIGQYSQNRFYLIIDACFSGSFIGSLWYDGLSNLLALLTSTDANHYAYGDCDGKKDPNPEDSGGEWTSGFYETLLDYTSSEIAWNLVQYIASFHRVEPEQVLYKISFDEAYELDCTRISKLSFPQYCGWTPSRGVQ